MYFLLLLFLLYTWGQRKSFEGPDGASTGKEQGHPALEEYVNHFSAVRGHPVPASAKAPLELWWDRGHWWELLRQRGALRCLGRALTLGRERRELPQALAGKGKAWEAHDHTMGFQIKGRGWPVFSPSPFNASGQAAGRSREASVGCTMYFLNYLLISITEDFFSHDFFFELVVRFSIRFYPSNHKWHSHFYVWSCSCGQNLELV